MTLRINDNKGFKFTLWLPTSLLKSKLVLKNIKKHCDANIDPLIDLLPIIYKSLKSHIKKKDHFVLVEIKNSDGDTIIIKV